MLSNYLERCFGNPRLGRWKSSEAIHVEEVRTMIVEFELSAYISQLKQFLRYDRRVWAYLNNVPQVREVLVLITSEYLCLFGLSDRQEERLHGFEGTVNHIKRSSVKQDTKILFFFSWPQE